MKDSGDFSNTAKHLLSNPEDAILVTAKVVSLYVNIPHEVWLHALRVALHNREKSP